MNMVKKSYQCHLQQQEFIILSEGSQKEKDKYHMISLIRRIFIYKTEADTQTEKRLVVAQGRECGGGGD